MNRREEKTGRQGNQKGVALIAVVFIIIILAFMGVMFLSMVNTASLTSVNDIQSTRALYVAEGGNEYILENRPFPNYSTGGSTINLGAGNFSVAASTYLTADPGAAGTTINVQSAANFPASGRIVIESELIDYTGKTANSFTGATRGAGGTTAVSHPTANAAVYPVTTLTADPGAGNTVSVNSTVGFLIPGTIKIDEEYIYCTGTNAPATTQFTGCTRGYKGTLSDTHPVGRNVFQYVVTSTGTVGNAKRQVEMAVAGTGVSTHQGWFAKNNTGVANAVQSITGVGFRPTAVIFFWTRQTAVGFTPQNSTIDAGIGFASAAANVGSVSVTAVDRSANSSDGRERSATYPIIFLTGGGVPALSARARLTSLDPDGFTLTWATNDVNAYIIHYIALGGDIINASAGSFNLTNVAANNVVNTLTFRPNFVMFLWSFTEAVDTLTASAELGIGLAKSAAAQGAMVFAARDAQANNAQKRWQQRTNASILVLNPVTNPPAQYAVASLVSLDANGFTVSKSTVPAANVPIFYLALQGGQHTIGSFNKPAAVGNQNITGVGFQPEQLIMVSRNLAATLTIDGLGAVSIGAAQQWAQSPAARGGIWFQDRSDNDPSDVNSYISTTDAITFARGNAAAAVDANPTALARADFVAFGSDDFTINWTLVDATARQILYWAIGPNVARSGANIKPVNLDWREVYP